MESELPSQRNCFAHLTPQTFGMFGLKTKQNRTTLNWTKAAASSRQLFCKTNRKADLLTPGLELKTFFRVTPQCIAKE